MKALSLHSWKVSPAQAREIQRELAPRVSLRDEIGEVRLVAGADISAPDSRGLAIGAAVVVTYPELATVEVKAVQEPMTFPYIPGLLSFRETPLILAAWEKLETAPDLLLVDGQGLAHPRRLGLACHLGLLLDIPAIGCAKSLLWGRHGEVGPCPGDWAEIREGEDVLGAALRTRREAAPVYVSIGHKVSLASAISWVLACCRGRRPSAGAVLSLTKGSGQRIPEPLRLAHQAASGRLPPAPIAAPGSTAAALIMKRS